MKYYNDPAFLDKIGQKLGGVLPGGAGGAAPAAAAPPPAALQQEVTDLIAAARVGDEEAVEDFIAIGKVCVCVCSCAGGLFACSLSHTMQNVIYQRLHCLTFIRSLCAPSPGRRHEGRAGQNAPPLRCRCVYCVLLALSCHTLAGPFHSHTQHTHLLFSKATTTRASPSC